MRKAAVVKHFGCHIFRHSFAPTCMRAATIFDLNTTVVRLMRVNLIDVGPTSGFGSVVSTDLRTPTFRQRRRGRAASQQVGTTQWLLSSKAT